MNDRQPTRVKDVMKTGFDMVDGMDTVQMALERMIHIDTKSLIVKKRHNDDEYGLVTLSDIARLVLANDRAPERVNIYEIMIEHRSGSLFHRSGLAGIDVEQRGSVGSLDFVGNLLDNGHVVPLAEVGNALD